MPQRRTLTLTTEQRTELERTVASHVKAYMRERAAALLKIADGQSPYHVAQHGLLRERDPDTVYAWLTNYEQAGLAGLQIQPGRGRKPAFSPSAAKRP